MHKNRKSTFGLSILAKLMALVIVVSIALLALRSTPVASTPVLSFPIHVYEEPAEAPVIPPCTYHLDEFFSQFGNDLAVFYKNLDTGFVYTFNPDVAFFTASLNKAQHALYTYIAAERGYIDMYAMHTFTSEDFWGGTGIIRFKPAGTRFTTRELLRHSIVYSDNIAYRMLVRYMEQINFSYQDFATQLGTSDANNISVSDMALWLQAINNYVAADSNYGHYLLHDLLNTAEYSHPYFTRGGTFGGNGNVQTQFIHSGYPVAQKYGWFTNAFNTAGIIKAPSPFMLVILSNMDDGAHELFREISWRMHEFNELAGS